MKKRAKSMVSMLLLCSLLITALFSGCSDKNTGNSTDGGSTGSVKNSQTVTQVDTKTYDEFFDRLIQGELTGNASVTVVTSDKVLYKYAKGTENFGKGQTTSESMRYEAGTLTMPVIATLVLTLADNGKIDVDKPIKDYMPDIKLEKATVKQVMMNLSGWGENSTTEYCNNQSEYNDIVSKVKNTPNAGTPGEKFTYNVDNYVLLKLLVEKVSGKTLEQYAKEKLFTPLGMSSSTFDTSTLTAGTYMKRYNEKQNALVDGKGNIATGDQGLFTTAADLGKFCSMLLSSDKKVLSKKSKALLMEEQTGGAFDSTLGFWVKGEKNTLKLFGKYNNSDALAHSGDSGCLMALDPKTGTAFVFLANSDAIYSDWVIYSTLLNEYATMVDTNLAQRLKPLTYEAKRADSKPVIDGTINTDEWAKSGKYTLSYDQNVKNGRGCSFWDLLIGTDQQPPYRVSSEYYFLWDSDNLYVACKVTDAKVVCVAEIGKALNNQDTVQIAFDPMRHKKNTQEDSYIFDFSPISGIESNGPATWYEHWQYNAMDTSLGVNVKGKLTDKGYDLEMVIPWSALRNNGESFKAESGTEMGIGLLNVDFDTVGNRQDLLTDFGNGDNVILDASSYNTLKLN